MPSVSRPAPPTSRVEPFMWPFVSQRRIPPDCVYAFGPRQWCPDSINVGLWSSILLARTPSSLTAIADWTGIGEDRRTRPDSIMRVFSVTGSTNHTCVACQTWPYAPFPNVLTQPPRPTAADGADAPNVSATRRPFVARRPSKPSRTWHRSVIPDAYAHICDRAPSMRSSYPSPCPARHRVSSALFSPAACHPPRVWPSGRPSASPPKRIDAVCRPFTVAMTDGAALLPIDSSKRSVPTGVLSQIFGSHFKLSYGSWPSPFDAPLRGSSNLIGACPGLCVLDAAPWPACTWCQASTF